MSVYERENRMYVTAPRPFITTAAAITTTTTIADHLLAAIPRNLSSVGMGLLPYRIRAGEAIVEKRGILVVVVVVVVVVVMVAV